jgi:hypothetical protein
MLTTIKLSATGHGDDTYRSFEQILETISGFPLFKVALTGYYTLYPTVDRQTITTLFAYLKAMVTHLIDQTGSAPFSGGAATLTPKGPMSNPNCTKNADLRDGRRRNGAAGKMRLSQVILQAAGFKPKHRPFSLAWNVRLSVWPKSNACRPCLPHRQTCNSKFFRCSSMRI